MPQWTDYDAPRPELRANIALTVAIALLFAVAAFLTLHRDRHHFPSGCIVLDIDQDTPANFTTVRLHCHGILEREDIK